MRNKIKGIQGHQLIRSIRSASKWKTYKVRKVDNWLVLLLKWPRNLTPWGRFSRLKSKPGSPKENAFKLRLIWMLSIFRMHKFNLLIGEISIPNTIRCFNRIYWEKIYQRWWNSKTLIKMTLASSFSIKGWYKTRYLTQEVDIKAAKNSKALWRIPMLVVLNQRNSRSRYLKRHLPKYLWVKAREDSSQRLGMLGQRCKWTTKIINK